MFDFGDEDFVVVDFVGVCGFDDCFDCGFDLIVCYYDFDFYFG